VEGFGSDGRLKRLGMAVYGGTKSAVRYFTDSIAQELGPRSAVKVGSLVPGVVVTDMLVGQFDRARPEAWERARRVYNVIGDTVETAAPWLAARVLSNRRNGARISRFSVPQLVWRFVSPRYRRRDLFEGRALPATAPAR
jgi:short-subunit dehydrogenase